MNISRDLDAIIRELVPSAHELDQDVEFDPVAFLNRKFPEDANIDAMRDYSESLRRELAELDLSLGSEFRGVAIGSAEGDKCLSEVRHSMGSLSAHMESIHDKVTSSAASLKSFSSDLLALSQARSNVSSTMNIMKQMVTVMGACDQLSELARSREYRQVSPLVVSIKELIHESLGALKNNDRVSELLSNVENLFHSISEQVMDDYVHISPSVDFSGAAETAEALGIEPNIVNGFCMRMMKSYEFEFCPPDGISCGFSRFDDRFQWLSKQLAIIRDEYAKCFPNHWMVNGELCMHFCHFTRRHCVQLLDDAKSFSESIIAVLHKCIDLETDMQRRFEKMKSAQPPRNPNFSSLQFTGLISASFGPYIGQWVAMKQEELLSKFKGATQKIIDADNPVFNSAIQLIGEMRNILKEAKSMKNDSHVIPKFGAMISHVIEEYAKSILETIINSSNQRDLRAVVGTCDYLVDAVSHFKVPTDPLDILMNIRRAAREKLVR
jgi:hypothetical protein